MNNANIEYEKFAQEVYQELVNADVVKSTEVRHDIKILGKSGQKHQIDVYWEYEIAEYYTKLLLSAKIIISLFPSARFVIFMVFYRI